MKLTSEYILDAFQTPVSRDRLKYVLNCKTDRQARKVLALLQNDYNIINMQDGTGYKIATDEETKLYIRQEFSRIKNIHNKLIRMSQHCSQVNKDQMIMEEVI